MGQDTGPGSTTVTESRDPEAIREEIQATRQELGDTVEALTHKADVKAQARAKVDDVKHRITDKRDESVGRLKDATPDSAGQAASTATTKARENRTPLIVAGVAAAAFLLGRATGRR